MYVIIWFFTELPKTNYQMEFLCCILSDGSVVVPQHFLSLGCLDLEYTQSTTSSSKLLIHQHYVFIVPHLISSLSANNLSYIYQKMYCFFCLLFVLAKNAYGGWCLLCLPFRKCIQIFQLLVCFSFFFQKDGEMLISLVEFVTELRWLKKLQYRKIEENFI